MVGETNKQQFNEIKSFLILQLELRLELGFRLRLTKNKSTPQLYVSMNSNQNAKPHLQFIKWRGEVEGHQISQTLKKSSPLSKLLLKPG
jgi:hypothetical protein